MPLFTSASSQLQLPRAFLEGKMDVFVSMCNHDALIDGPSAGTLYCYYY